MHLDVLDLRAFYYRTRLGRSAQRALQEALRGLWPETRGLTVVGFGFAAPMLGRSSATPARVMALMPAQQGVMPWPAGRPEPLRAGRGDPVAARRRHRRPADRRARARDLRAARTRSSPRSGGCSRPAAGWSSSCRTAPASGRARDVTPFGFGRPYSFGQLESLLRKHRFAPGAARRPRSTRPPSHRKFWLQTAYFWERLGRRFDPRLLAGALLVEASKQVYARPPSTGREGRGARAARGARGARRAGAGAGRAAAAKPRSPRRDAA